MLHVPFSTPNCRAVKLMPSGMNIVKSYRRLFFKLKKGNKDMAKLITIVLGVLCFYCSRAQIDSLQTTDTLIRRDSVIRADTLVTVTESLPLTPSALDRDKKRVYKLKPAIDVPLTAAGSAWTLYAFSVIYGRDPG